MKFKLFATSILFSVLLASCGGKSSKCDQVVDLTIVKANAAMAKAPDAQKKMLEAMVNSMKTNRAQFLTKCNSMSAEKIDKVLMQLKK